MQNYRQEQLIYDNKLYAFSLTYHDGTLKLHAHHLTAPNIYGGRQEYYMFQLKAYAVSSDLKTFIQGATAFRNLRDLAKRYRDASIEHANVRYQQDTTATKESNITTGQGSKARRK
jgi:hypothetical protein